MGEPDPYAMLADMDSALFDRWCDYYAGEPFGPQIVPWMLAQLTAIYVGSKTGEREDASDFLPVVGDDDDDDDDDTEG
jgi:hypothetical protein